MSDGEFEYPSETTLLWDGVANVAAPVPLLLPWAEHNGMTNIAFLDGHVKAAKNSRSLTAPYSGNDYYLGCP